MNNISKWVSEGLKKGYTKEELKSRLKEKGYSEKEIENALAKKRSAFFAIIAVIAIASIIFVIANPSVFKTEKNETKQACIDYYKWECESYFADSIEFCKGNENCTYLYNLRQAIINNDLSFCDKMKSGEDYCINLVNKDDKDCGDADMALKEECITHYSRNESKCIALENPRAKGSCLIFATDNKKYCSLLTETC